jgi:phosphopantetheinyl transferase (holo-ACP synthase)
MNAMLSTAIAKDGDEARLALTTQEAEQCARLAGRRPRSDYRAGRLAAKRAVCGSGSAHPHRRIQISSLADEAPRLSVLDRHGRERSLDARVSISHRDGLAVAMVAPPGVRVGVDLERSGSVPLQAIRHFLTPAERGMVMYVDPAVLWSLKEAAWKALGLGPSVPLHAMELRTDGPGQLLGVTVRDVFVPMHTRMSRPFPGFHAAAIWMTGGVA